MECSRIEPSWCLRQIFTNLVQDVRSSHMELLVDTCRLLVWIVSLWFHDLQEEL
jgi:hypothetical protein